MHSSSFFALQSISRSFQGALPVCIRDVTFFCLSRCLCLFMFVFAQGVSVARRKLGGWLLCRYKEKDRQTAHCPLPIPQTYTHSYTHVLCFCFVYVRGMHAQVSRAAASSCRSCLEERSTRTATDAATSPCSRNLRPATTCCWYKWIAMSFVVTNPNSVQPHAYLL